MMLLVLGIAALTLLQTPGMVRAGEWRELVAFSILLLLGFVLSALIALDVALPPISTSIHNLIKSLFHLSNSFGLP